jgi:ATPase subunit of ABC transporter with duplicated ATPase domains
MPAVLRFHQVSYGYPGKSTLVQRILRALDLPAERLVYVPQEIDVAGSNEALMETQSLRREERGRVMAVISHLGSDPQRLLESALPSPGELRKLLLARGVARAPHLIVMDEPTNHLDLPSIECLERALAGSPCALILVSHDERFLCSLQSVRWNIETRAPGRFEVVVRGIDPK